jgi:tRNA-specific 2-thiouridylase
MSGGVDSSVAAALLVDQGFDVVGITIKTFCYTHAGSGGKTCCGLDGITDARRVAGSLGIPHYVFDMEESFTRSVIDDFVHEYASGRTPNPCVRCNSNTKIPHLLERGRLLGADLVATGHYARVDVGEDGDVRVLRGVDRGKDQTYFLWGVPRDVAKALRFPVGHLTKKEVREVARRLGLITADKPESQEICFVPSGDYAEFLERRLGAGHAALSEGELVTASGEIVGHHGGFGRFTVGQRRGLGGGRGAPLYVLGVIPEQNRVVVGPREALLRTDIVLRDANWLSDPPRPGETVGVQIRHRARETMAKVVAFDGDEVVLELAQAQRAITPGQSGALYRGEELIGGGRIV